MQGSASKKNNREKVLEKIFHKRNKPQKGAGGNQLLSLCVKELGLLDVDRLSPNPFLKNKHNGLHAHLGGGGESVGQGSDGA